MFHSSAWSSCCLRGWIIATSAAWPLKRAIQQQIENPLAREILAGRFTAGDTVSVTVANGNLAFARK